MEIVKFKKNSIMVRISKSEALEIISSLAMQIYSKDSNSYRNEFYPEKGAGYFSIAVLPEEEQKGK